MSATHAYEVVATSEDGKNTSYFTLRTTATKTGTVYHAARERLRQTYGALADGFTITITAATR